jgi:chemotaxis-related protein WspD
MINLDKIILQKGEKCWETIGVFGAGVCDLLNEYDHCKHCPVYVHSGRKLLERPITEDLIEEWSEIFRQEKAFEIIDRISVVVFSISGDWLAIRTDLFQEAVVYKFVHFVPGRSNKYFLGVVNINGELSLSISMATFLDLPEVLPINDKGKNVYKVMLVLNETCMKYAFPVDEFEGVISISAGSLEETPATLSKNENTISTKVFNHRNNKIGLIDDKKLLEILRRRLIW